MSGELFDFSKQPSESRWLIRDFIPLGHLCFLLAQSGSGKSYLVEAISLHVAFGIPFCGMDTNYGDVLIFDQDTPQDVFDKRILKIGKGLGLAPKFNVRCFNMRNYSIANSTIPDLINQYKPRLVIVDSLHSVCGKLNPNKTSDMSIWAKVKSQCLNPDLTILVCHHISEKIIFTVENLMDNEMHISGMGNSSIKQQADTEYILASSIDKAAGKIENLYIRPIPKRQAIPQRALTIKLLEPDKDTMLFEFGGYYETDTTQEQQDVLLLFESTGSEFTVKEIREAMGQKYGENALREALKQLELKNRLIMMRTRHNLFKFRLPSINTGDD